MAKHIWSRRLFACALGAGVALVAGAVTQAAQLEFDLRVTALSSGTWATIGPGGKSVVITDPAAAVGKDIIFRLYAIVTGNNSVIIEGEDPDTLEMVPVSTDDGFQQTHGSFYSPAPTGHAILGSIRGVPEGTATANLRPGFNTPPAQSGDQADLDGDGDLDVGNFSTVYDTNITTVEWFVASSGAAPVLGAIDGTPVSSEFEIGITRFRISAIQDAISSTQIQYAPRIRDTEGVAGQNHIYRVDGVAMAVNGDSPNIAVRAPISITIIPEPASLALLGLGGLLLARRRRA